MAQQPSQRRSEGTVARRQGNPARRSQGGQRRITASVVDRAIDVAMHPGKINQVPQGERQIVEKVAKAVTGAASWTRPPRGNQQPKPVPVNDVARRAVERLAPDGVAIPGDIELALRRQGIDWIEPFAPGRPLVPYYGYNRRPRQYDYRVGRNITSEARPDRIPFATLKQLYDGYDIAQTAVRHTINDLRSMKLLFRPLDGFEKEAAASIVEARRRLRKPDGKTPFVTWLAKWMHDVLIYDAGALYRQRDKAGRLQGLIVVDGTSIAPMVDYYGDVPAPPAPAYQQFIQGIPWDWLSTDDLIYSPMWPSPASPYGTPALETVLVNANTDVRLQMFFLQFFTAGSVPEMMLTAPPDMSDPDSLAEMQELWDDWYEANQSGRHGARWVPEGTKALAYKNIEQLDPKIAEYVARRTIAAFQRIPQDLGITSDVNRATSETQVDTQFRISTRPNMEYYSAFLNDELQEGWGLPVEVSFDDGREVQDRLMEAKAHQIYVSIGAESPDEVRESVLGYEVDNDNKVPRFFDSDRLGPTPLSFVYSVSGKVNPDSLSPAGPVPQQPFVPLYGIREDIPAPGQQQSLQQPRSGQQEPAKPKGKGTRKPKGKKRPPRKPDVKPSTSTGQDQAKPTTSSAPAGVVKDLARWRSNARKRVANGQAPRLFENSQIPQPVVDVVWDVLKNATSRADVDGVFDTVHAVIKALDGGEPPISGVALRAADTGRVLMLQRARTEGDPAAGALEFPGGHVDPGEDSVAAGRREWQEETGVPFPPNARKVSEWTSTNGVYRGHVFEVPTEAEVPLTDRGQVDNPDNPDGDVFEAVMWMEPGHLSNNPMVRRELAAEAHLAQAAIAGVAKAGDGEDPKGPAHGGTLRGALSPTG